MGPRCEHGPAAGIAQAEGRPGQAPPKTLSDNRGLEDVIRPVMVLLLISLALVVALMNMVGIRILTGTAVWRRLFGRIV